MESKRLELVTFSVLFAGLSVLVFFVFQPFLRVIVVAAVLSILFHPAYKKLIRLLGGRRSFVACLLVLVALIFIIIPVLFLSWQIFEQAQNFFQLNQIGQGQNVETVNQGVDFVVRHIIPNFSFDLSSYISKIAIFISNNFEGLLSQGAYVFFQIFFLLFSFFFFLRDGDKMFESLVDLSPFRKEQNKEIVDSVNRTITSVIRGTLFVGFIRLVLLATSFYFLGIPNALLWGSLGGLVGAVPGLGTPFAVVPAFLYLLFSGHLISAIGIAVVGILIIFFIDNMLSTYFFGQGLDVPSIFVLFAILGGIIFFGPLGFIFGPIILSLFISTIDMYKILVLKKS